MQVVHLTDLFNPPGDPDDHFDLVTLLSIPDLAVAGVVIDHTVERGAPGVPTVAKAAALFERDPIPCAAGLPDPLKSETDTGLDRPPAQQGAIELILSCLENCPDHQMVFTIVCSMRDLAAAYNRVPELFHAKVARLMVNAGDSCGEVGPRDWNTALDLAGWRRIMSSGLTIDWFPCNPSKGRGTKNNHTTWWGFPQDEFLTRCPAVVREFFDSEGISSSDPVWRHMWSTASILEVARMQGCAGISPASSYEMTPVEIRLGEDGTALWSLASESASSRSRIFKIKDPEAYGADMDRFLRDRLTQIGERQMAH